MVFQELFEFFCEVVLKDLKYLQALVSVNKSMPLFSLGYFVNWFLRLNRLLVFFVDVPQRLRQVVLPRTDDTYEL